MKMNSHRIICHALILIFLMAVSGCAKRMVAAQDVDQLETGNSAVIKEIKINDDATQVEIITSKPLTYTSYKTSNPAKVYIDLAQTEPGSESSRDIKSGNITNVTVNRQDFGSGFLSRIEIALQKDTDFSVKTSPNNKGILIVSFAPVVAEEKTTPAEPAPAVTQTNADAKEPAEVKAEALTVVPVAAVASTPAVEPAKTDSPAKAESKALSAVTVAKDKVEVVVTGGQATFTSFKLDKPERLVVDLFETASSLKTGLISINAFGISKARIGTTPEKVRLVFDPAKEKLPPYKILKTATGLDITFADSTAEPVLSKAPEPVLAPVKSMAEVAKSPGKGTLESVDFKIFDGNSRVMIKTAGDCAVGKPIKTSRGLSLAIKNCQVPKNLQRAIDTKAFNSPILSITPYQVKVAGGIDTRVLIKLRNDTPFTEKKEGDTYILDFKNPPASEPPAIISGKVRERDPLAPRKIEEELMAQSRESDSVDLPKSVVAKQLPRKIYNGRKVTLEFSDADIRKIFQLIAEVSNLNFLIADDVTGTISIKLVNVPWDQALDVILDTKSLGMVREGNIVQIKPRSKMQSLADEELLAKKARERGMELRTEVFDVNYSNVTEISTLFNGLKSERGTISSDARTNRVIVKDIATAIEDMKSLLKSLDTPEKQVMIEARIVEAQTSFVRDLGVQWGIHYTDGSASLAGISRIDTGFGGQVTAPVTSGTSGPGASMGVSFGKLASNIQLDMRLSAAVTADQIKIMSTPRVVTLNNKPAKISQGASIPYQTTSAEGTKTEFVEAALTLEVTPHITADGSIGMKIKASNNSAGAGSPPPINKKEATTELLVKNGETTVIGGIYVDSETESDKGVPFLQDIPLLGWLFKSNSKNKTKNELLIFITPKIVS